MTDGITMADGITMTNAIIECLVSRSTTSLYNPAFTLTDASLIMPEAYRERVKEMRPLKKHLYPEDVAGAVAFLAGDEAAMLTGSHILVTGGSHLQL